jgi:hypothetical protein
MAPELLAHLQTPAALGGHEVGDWPPEYIANGLAVTWTPTTATTTPATPGHPSGSADPARVDPTARGDSSFSAGHRAHPIRTPYFALMVQVDLRKRWSAQRWAATYSHGGVLPSRLDAGPTRGGSIQQV